SVLAIAAGVVTAQDAPPPPGTLPIPRFAVDVRAAFPKFKQDTTLATSIGVTAANLPTRAYGLVVGAHWYPMRYRAITFGVGGELVKASKSRTLTPAKQGDPEGPTVTTRFSSLAPQVSFNFGKREGWSYLSGGIGRSIYTTERVDAPQPDPESRTKTI